VFRNQAEHFALLGSPVYARLAMQLADDPAPARPIVGDDPSWDLGLRLFAAVHYHVLSGASPDALSGEWNDFSAALAANDVSLRRFVREQGVQTNETQRCIALVPAFLTLARETGLPLDLVELGPSAGLNLVFDRYRYAYAEGEFGDPGARLSFSAIERARVPAELLRTPIEIRGRRGIDLAPIDVSGVEGSMLLHSFLWPGSTGRAARLDAAIETLLASPVRPELLRGDYVAVLPEILARRSSEALTVVFQTASTGYLPQREYDTLLAALEPSSADGRPLAWVSTRRREEREFEDGDCWELELRLWPAPPRLVALVDFHGNWVDWLAGA
jgi:hypothetical protein